jgi:hypothetical protein
VIYSIPISPFRRILPLPSESWAEFSGGIFCHYHGKQKGTADDHVGCMSTPSAIKIHPREGDCLFSASVLLVLTGALDRQSFNKVTSYEEIMCC